MRMEGWKMNAGGELLAGSPLSTSHQRSVEQERVHYFETGKGTPSDKLNSMTRFMSRQNMAKLVAYHEVFRMTRDVVGSILECGVYFGNGLMAYANLAAALEPYNYQCRIVGFDTFEGDVAGSARDAQNPHFTREKGDFLANSYEDLGRAIAIFDADRPLSHLPKIELVKGDVCETAAAYLAKNPALSVRILHLSVNLYEPTKRALDVFLPRVPRGGAVVVHGINYSAVGATQAVLESMRTFGAAALRTFDFYPNMCYWIV